MARTQFLDHNVIRIKGLFTASERSLLLHLVQYSGYCRDKVPDIGATIGSHERTVRRAINGLIQKGMITKQYGPYKRLFIKIVPTKDQRKHHGLALLAKDPETVTKEKSNRAKSYNYYRAKPTSTHRANNPYSNKERNLKNKKLVISSNLEPEIDETPIPEGFNMSNALESFYKMCQTKSVEMHC